MVKMIYLIDPKDKEAELQWLRDQHIFAGHQDLFDWSQNKTITHIGVIVTPEMATMIKLRHQLSAQDDYKRSGR